MIFVNAGNDDICSILKVLKQLLRIGTASTKNIPDLDQIIGSWVELVVLSIDTCHFCTLGTLLYRTILHVAAHRCGT